MPFLDRSDAGRKLADRLVGSALAQPVVLALVRGGLTVAAEIAARLEAPLDIVLVRKIGVPFQPEIAMGAVVDGDRPMIVRNEDVIRHAMIDDTAFRAVAERELAEIERRRAVYLSGRARAAIEGRVAIVVDDGIATGATMRAALRAVRRHRPRKLVLAVPVAPIDQLDALRAEADEIICLEVDRDLGSVGQYYRHFPQVSDDEVVAILDRFSPRRLAVPRPGDPAAL